MSHDIVANKSTGHVPFAFTGPRSEIWHGLGQALDQGQSIDTWKTAAGFDWSIASSPAYYDANDGSKLTFPGKMTLRRADTDEPLSIVSERFKIVQPGEVLEFFRDLVEDHGMQLSTAGILKNGLQYWALAETGKKAEIVDGDYITGQLLLTTSVDGMQSTQAKFVSTRVVCANTLSLALKGNGKAIRVTHKQDFDAKQVKMDLGILDQSWATGVANMQKLASIRMTDKELRDFASGLFYDKTRAADNQPYGIDRIVESVIAKASRGSGSEMHRGTRWGALCGITETFTHIESTRMTDETKFMSAYMGEANDKKSDAYLELLMMP